MWTWNLIYIKSHYNICEIVFGIGVRVDIKNKITLHGKTYKTHIDLNKNNFNTTYELKQMGNAKQI